jgi:hypothetical protein
MIQTHGIMGVGGPVGRTPPSLGSSALAMAEGGVVEWLMAPVLKTGDPKGSVGSNPTPSVNFLLVAHERECGHSRARREATRTMLLELNPTLA